MTVHIKLLIMTCLSASNFGLSTEADECPKGCRPVPGKRACNRKGFCSDGCTRGWYGNHCNMSCNAFCFKRVCNQHNGDCSHSKCKANYCWNGGEECYPCNYSNPTDCKTRCFSCNPICSACLSGWYGENCSKQCSECPGECHKDTGYCVWCGNGTYGPACNEKCPANCKKKVTDNATCNISDGRCSNGCLDGFYGKTCNFSCGKCSDGVCDQVTGDCKNGCTNGWDGSKCNVSCLPNCMTCVDNSTCVTCSPGYDGPQCNGISSNSKQSDSGQTDTTVAVAVSVTVLVIICVTVIICKLLLDKSSARKCWHSRPDTKTYMYPVRTQWT